MSSTFCVKKREIYIFFAGRQEGLTGGSSTLYNKDNQTAPKKGENAYAYHGR